MYVLCKKKDLVKDEVWIGQVVNFPCHGTTREGSFWGSIPLTWIGSALKRF